MTTRPEDWLLLAIEAGEFGVWKLDADAQNLAASATCRLHLNLPAEQPLTYADLLGVLGPEARDPVDDAVRHSLEYGGPLDIEFRRAGSDDCWVKLKARPQRAPSGEILFLAGVSLNFTDPHRASDELQQMQILIRGVLETETGLIYAKDRDGRMLLANPPVLRLIGKAWAKVKGRTDAEFLNDTHQGEAVMENDRRVMASGATEVLEERVDCPDGRTAIWLSTKSPLRDEQGRIVGLVGVSQDISERKHVERQLLELNETLEQRVADRTRERDRAWNNSQDMQLIIDGKGIMTAVNPAWTAILGWSAEELIGRSFLDFLHPDHRLPNQDALVVARAARLHRHENRYRHKDGSYRWIEWVTAPDGDLIFASGRHVTAEKEAATALAAKAKQLEISNQELESFSYSVSHDLRSPVRAIDGFANILADEHAASLDAEGRRLLAAILRNSHRMGLLIDDLLAFSRLSHVPICPSAVDIHLLVTDVISELTRDIPGKPPDIRLGELIAARGDRSMLRQLWMNIVANAVKYSSKSAAPRIDISSQTIDAEVVYCVRDNGVGFDMKYADKLFGVFQRLHADADFKGTGVGLALAQRIVNRHGGRIWAEGQLAQGASFYFTIPG